MAIRKAKILVVDDEASLRLLLNNELTRAGYVVDVVADGEEALKKVKEDYYHVILLDIIMPRRDGVSVLKAIKEDQITSEVIILTGNATLESAIECMKLGAFDYVRKPYALNELLIQIERALSHQQAELERTILKKELERSGYGGTVVGNSATLGNLRAIIARLAPTPSTVLILGESGSGKEVVARAIHEKSLVAGKSFVPVNCASLSENLLESELFGHERGAFTDAKQQKRGLAEIADGGTLFLDEIGEIPLHFQAKILRFLETGEIRRVGGTKDITLNVRIVCATNKPLEELVAKNQFRADLYYRLNVLSINVPPLREHTDDIPDLLNVFMEQLGQHKKFDDAAIKSLCSYDWPGNVRELKNVVERTCLLAPDKIISAEHLLFLQNTSSRSNPEPQLSLPDFDTSALSLAEMERRHIINVLQHAKGHKGNTAKMLQINSKTLYLKMREYNIMSKYE